jgi:hypothetical protein
MASQAGNAATRSRFSKDMSRQFRTIRGRRRYVTSRDNSFNGGPS